MLEGVFDDVVDECATQCFNLFASTLPLLVEAMYILVFGANGLLNH